MARTKQAVRRTTGVAPRKQLAQKAIANHLQLEKKRAIADPEERERFGKLQRVSALPSEMPDVDTVQGALHRIRLACVAVMSYLEKN